MAENKQLVKCCSKLRKYCIAFVNTFDKCLEYENEIKELKKENLSLKEKIKSLKNYIQHIFYILEKYFNISKIQIKTSSKIYFLC